MKNTISKDRFIENLPYGFASHKIVLDPKGKPCDYVFLEINKAFENITGLKKTEVIGKKASEAIVTLKDDIFDWISYYGEISLNTGTNDFIYYSEILDKWFKVFVVSYKKYYFSSFFLDITDLKKESSGSINKLGHELNKTIFKKNIDEEITNSSSCVKEEIFDKNLDEIYILNPYSWKIIDTNSKAISSLGYEKDELTDLLFTDILTDITVQDFSEIVNPLLLKKSDKISFTANKKRKDGSKCSCEITIYLIERSALYLLVFSKNLSFEKEDKDLSYIEKKYFDYILEAGEIATWRWNLLTNETEYNEQWAKMLGYTLKELAPLSEEVWRKLVHPDDLIKSDELIEKHFKGETEFYSCEIRMKHKDGTYRWIEDKGKVLYWSEDGKPLLMFGIHIDITDRKKYEQILKESGELFRNLTESVLSGVVLFQNGKCIYVNPFFCNLIGAQQKDLLNIDMYEFFDEENIEQVNLICERAKKKIKEKEPFIVKIKSSNHTVTWVAATCSAISVNATDSLIFSFLDISKLKSYEDELNIFKNTIQYSSYAIGMATPSGKHYYQNEAFDKLFGKIGNNPVESIYLDKKVGERVFSTIMSGETYFDDVKMYSKEGKIIDIRLKAYPLKDKNNKITALIGFHENITEKKEQEERYRLLFETSNDAIFIMEDAKFIECNEKALQIFNTTKEQIINATPYDFSPEKQEDGCDSKEKAIEKINHALEGDSEVFEWTHKTSDGNLIYTDVSLNSLEIGGKRLIQAIVRDITEKKKIEEELRNTNEELHEIINAANLGTWIWDIQTNQVIYNEIWAKMLGYNLNELQQDLSAWGNLTDPEDLKFAFEKLEKHFKGETEFYECEMRMKHRSGKWIWILDKGKVISRTVDGKPLLMFGIHMDITSQKETFFKVEESEKRYHTIMNNAADEIFIHDFSDNIIDINEKSCQMLQYSREELLRMKVSDIDKMVNDKNHDERLEKIKNGEQIVLESSHIKKDGNLFPVEIHLSSIELEQKRYVLAIARDITERKLYEKSILEEQRKLSTTLQSIGDGVIAVDIQGKITIINKMAQILTEYSEKEALGKNIDDILYLFEEKTNTRIINPIVHVLKSHEKVELPMRTILISKTFKRYLISDSISPILDDEKKIIGVVLVFRDITEKEKLVAQNLKAQKLESLGIMSSGIAHDFNNLLAGIYSHINLALMESKNQDVNDLLIESLKTMDRAKALTTQLLAFAKGGKPVLKAENIESFLEDTVKLALTGSNIIPVFKLAKNTKMVLCDKNMIDQIIYNLVINARQAMSKGGKITITSENCFYKDKKENDEKNDEYVCIKVIDEGEGIPPEKISKIFDPFYTTKADGHGLGLAISYTIARQHNGFLEVESEIDKGSTFSLYLPVAMKDDIDLFYEAKREKNKEKITSMENNKKKVLILDDEISILKSASKFLEKKGFIVETADNGDSAIKKFQESYNKNEPFDFLIFDLTIPGGMGGKEVIEKVRKLDKSVIAFVSSGYSDDNIISEPEKYGFNEAIQKPYKLEDILTMIEKYLK